MGLVHQGGMPNAKVPQGDTLDIRRSLSCNLLLNSTFRNRLRRALVVLSGVAPQTALEPQDVILRVQVTHPNATTQSGTILPVRVHWRLRQTGPWPQRRSRPMRPGTCVTTGTAPP